MPHLIWSAKTSKAGVGVWLLSCKQSFTKISGFAFQTRRRSENKSASIQICTNIIFKSTKILNLIGTNIIFRSAQILYSDQHKYYIQIDKNTIFRFAQILYSDRQKYHIQIGTNIIFRSAQILYSDRHKYCIQIDTNIIFRSTQIVCSDWYKYYIEIDTNNSFRSTQITLILKAWMLDLIVKKCQKKLNGLECIQ